MGVCLCVFEKSQVVLSRDCGDSVYTSSALASKRICIGAVGSSRRGVGMDSYSTKASPWLRNAFVNLFQEVRNRNFYSRRLAVACSSLGVEMDLYRAVGCSRLGVEMDFYRTVGCSSLGVEMDLYRAAGCSRLGVEIELY